MGVKGCQHHPMTYQILSHLSFSMSVFMFSRYIIIFIILLGLLGLLIKIKCSTLCPVLVIYETQSICAVNCLLPSPVMEMEEFKIRLPVCSLVSCLIYRGDRCWTNICTLWVKMQSRLPSSQSLLFPKKTFAPLSLGLHVFQCQDKYFLDFSH